MADLTNVPDGYILTITRVEKGETKADVPIFIDERDTTPEQLSLKIGDLAEMGFKNLIERLAWLGPQTTHQNS